MSYLQYLKLYTRNRKNYGRFTKRCRKSNCWVHSLKVNDKIDAFDYGWKIATIIELQHDYDNNVTNLFIHYDIDECEDEWDEYITINHSKVTSTKIKPLHTYTPYHAYLFDPLRQPCQWDWCSRIVKCDTCSRRGCPECFVMESYTGSGHYECKLCMDRIEYQQLFESIQESLYNSYNIDINIIQLITDYSKGIIVSCSNKIEACKNEIFYNSKSDFDIDYIYSIQSHREHGYKHYQYKPKYKHDSGTFMIHGKYRRIFCVECNKRLSPCELCICNTMEIKPQSNETRYGILCHKHDVRECGYCKQQFDAQTSYANHDICDCNECGKNHCSYCVCQICYGCYGKDNMFECVSCLRICCTKRCRKYNEESFWKYICRGCFPKNSCDNCNDPTYNSCRDCGNTICHDCCTLNEWESCKGIAGKKCRIDTESMEYFDSIIRKSDYDKSRKSKMKEMKKMQRRNKYKNVNDNKRKIDKVFNIKSKRKFHRRYAMSLQF